jgi:hypothetical protein
MTMRIAAMFFTDVVTSVKAAIPIHRNFGLEQFAE